MPEIGTSEHRWRERMVRRASGGQHGLDNLGKLFGGIRAGERQAAPLAPAANCAFPPAPSHDVRVRCRPLVPINIRYGLRAGHPRMPPRTSTLPTPHPCLTSAGGCGGAGGTPSLLAKPRAVRVSVVDVRRKQSPAPPFTSIPPLSCLRDLLETRIARRYQRKRANGGGGVTTSRNRYTGLRTTSARRWGEGAVERGQQKAGTTACASRPAACAASPRRCPARTHRRIVPVRVCGRLSLPIVLYPMPIPTPEYRALQRACLVIPEISPRPPRPLVFWP
jgi:hypothetical protein